MSEQKVVCNIKSFESFALEFENCSLPFLEVLVTYPPSMISIPFIKTIPELGSMNREVSVGGFVMTFTELVTMGQVTDMLINKKDKVKEFADEYGRIYQESITALCVTVLMQELLLQVANQNKHDTKGWRLTVCSYHAGHRGYIVTFDYGEGCSPREYLSYDEVFNFLWEQLCKLKQ